MKTNFFENNKKYEAIKWQHYLEIYTEIWERFVEPPRVCEIGVWQGGSLKLWSDCSDFVLGVDIGEQPCEFPDNVLFKKVSQVGTAKYLEDENLGRSSKLKEVVGEHAPYDIIIDDASHNINLTEGTFFSLFDLVKPNGIYIIEDWASYTQLPSIWDFEFPNTDESIKEAGPPLPMGSFHKGAIYPLAKNLIRELGIWKDTHGRNFGASRFKKIEYYPNLLVITKSP